MPFRHDYYEILQVSPNASQEEVHTAYRRLSLMYHPDLGGDEKNMKLLNEAYKILGKQELRYQYDKWLARFANEMYERNDNKQASEKNNIHSNFNSEVRPWVRFWARLTDNYLYILVAGLIMAYSGNRFPVDIPGVVFNVIILLISPFAEAFFISNWGTTPGKWLLNTRVVDNAGNYLSYKTALLRNYNILVNGEAFGIPFVSFLTLSSSYNKLSADGATNWDESYSSKMLHGKVGYLRPAIAALFFTGVIYLGKL